jgi:hypothetical protein
MIILNGDGESPDGQQLIAGRLCRIEPVSYEWNNRNRNAASTPGPRSPAVGNMDQLALGFVQLARCNMSSAILESALKRCHIEN